MVKVLLVQQEEIPHYRVPIYNHLDGFLRERGFEFSVVSGRVQKGTPHQTAFRFHQMKMTVWNLVRLLMTERPDAVIFFVGLKYPYLFPVILLAKALRMKVLYWGHGRDLLDRDAALKNGAYALQHWLSDAIILYAEHLRPLVRRRFHGKVFVANNTLNLDADDPGGTPGDRRATLARYGIATSRNIVCVGRLEKRKHPDHLFEAFRILGRKDYGLVLIGPDLDGSSQGIHGDNVYRLGPVYGPDRFALLRACDVFCLPGHMGLSIVDAFHCGLPAVTEDVEHAPEIMYLKNGVNGFIVPRGAIDELAAKLRLLLADDQLRARFSNAAKHEITTAGHIDVMCAGFVRALEFALRGGASARKRRSEAAA
jgi:glycosyltransferase involved in cell wall biosynthesis